MPATATRNQGKTLFVKETLIDHPTANPKFVNDKWKEAGMEGTISETLVNKMRAQLKLTGNLRGTRSGEEGQGGRVKAISSGKRRGRKAKERAGRRPLGTHFRRGPVSVQPAVASAWPNWRPSSTALLFNVMSLGNLPEVEKALRQTRRALYSAFATKR